MQIDEKIDHNVTTIFAGAPQFYTKLLLYFNHNLFELCKFNVYTAITFMVWKTCMYVYMDSA